MAPAAFDWIDVAPIRRQPPRSAHIESIASALSVGDFVVISCDASSGSTASSEDSTCKELNVGKIIDIDDDRVKCRVNWWIKPSEEPIISPHIPTVSPTRCQFIVACGVPELVQTMDCKWVLASDVVNIAFVFHIDTVANLSFDCYGMRNGFFCRFRYNKGAGGVLLEELSYSSFDPFDGGELLCSKDDGTVRTVSVSYPSRIWYGIQSIRRTLLDPILNRQAQHQSTSQSASGYACMEAFLYLYRNLKQSTVHFLSVKRCQTLRWPDLSVSSASKTWDVALLRIDTIEALSELKGTIGVRAGIGIRKRLFGRHERVLAMAGDVTNFVTLLNDEEDSSSDDGRPPTLRTRKQGIDFVYFLESSTMSVRIRFQRTSVKDEVVQDYLTDASKGLRTTYNNTTTGAAHISVGTPFQFDGKVLFVSQVDILNNIVVGYEENNDGSSFGDPYLINYAQALEGIRQYSL
jgi:hypothetical protein